MAALLSLTSHELRQPTGLVRGYLRTLDSDPSLSRRAHKLVEDAMRAADRMVELLDEIGELARLKDAALRLTMKSTSVRSVLVQSVQAAELPDSHDVDLDVVAPMDVRRRLDEARMRMVFGTLIAILARAQTGAATIDLRLTKSRGAAFVWITPRSLLRGKVIDKPVDVSRGGSGMLLPIAEAIVKAHGGTLRERWIAGRWSGFTVKL